MRIARYVVMACAVGLALATLHYSLPSKTLVKIVGTEVLRQNVTDRTFFWAASNSVDSDGRIEVRFLNTVRPNGRTVVYRNQDTALGWPPYFKFDSADLQAAAQSASDSAQGRGEDEGWVMVTSYGWRSQMLAIYPNAVDIHPVDHRDASEFSAVRAIGFAVAILFMLSAWRLLRLARRSMQATLSRLLDQSGRWQKNLGRPIQRTPRRRR